MHGDPDEPRKHMATSVNATDASRHTLQPRVFMPLELDGKSVLKRYYPPVDYLDGYLTCILDCAFDPDAGLMGHSFRPGPQDSQEYLHLVSTTLVATQTEVHGKRFNAFQPPPEMSMHTVGNEMPCCPIVSMRI